MKPLLIKFIAAGVVLIAGPCVISADVAWADPLAIEPPAEILVAPTMPVSTATITGATDYVFRGVSQTRSDPAIFGAVDATYNQFYGHLGVENVDFGTPIDAEYDAALGWRPKAGPVALDFGVIRYGYANEPRGVHIDTVEWKAAATTPIAGGRIGGLIAWTNNYFGNKGNGTYMEINGATPRIYGWRPSGAFGRQFISAGRDYDTWNLGASHHLFKKLIFDLRYYDTDAHNRSETFGSRGVAAIKVSF